MVAGGESPRGKRHFSLVHASLSYIQHRARRSRRTLLEHPAGDRHSRGDMHHDGP